MSVTLKLHPAAAQEIEAQFYWYAGHNEGAARGYRAEIDHALESIMLAPERWPRFRRGARRYILARFPFAVVFRVRGDVVEVLAVVHERRKPNYWQTRLLGA